MVGEALLSVFTREPRDGLDYVRTEEFICTGTWKTKRVGGESNFIVSVKNGHRRSPDTHTQAFTLTHSRR